MMIGMLVEGAGCLLAGLLAIGFGIPVNEFSFGNTLILSGVIFTSAGLIILSLWVVARELKIIAERLGGGATLDWKGSALPSYAPAALPRPDEVGEMASAEQTTAEHPAWPGETAAP